MFWLDREEAARRLEEAATHLVSSRSDVVAVYLFGSLAEGRAVPGSDADLLIVLDRSELRWMDRPAEFSAFFDNAGVPVDLFCYTEEEAKSVPLAVRVLKQGKLVAHR
ncbi:MAG: nucleotidyltransferase domain-containing protein [Actinomycetota bacterium]